MDIDDVGQPYTITAAMLDGGSTDNCGAPSLSIPPTVITCANVGSVLPILLTADDGFSVDTCTANVTVVDETAPAAICQDVTLVLDGSGQATLTAAMVDNGSNDECGILSRVVDQTNFSCGDLGPNTVTLTVTDNYTNTDDCTATVTVEDNTAPAINLTPPLSVTVTLPATYTEPGFTAPDNCGDLSASVAVSGMPAWPPAPATYYLSYNVTDGGGNPAPEQVRELVVVADQPPVITLNNYATPPTVVNCQPGGYTEFGATALDTEDGDISGDIQIDEMAPFDSANLYAGTFANAVRYRVVDSYGNTTDEYRDVQVDDSDIPVITANSGSPDFYHEVGQPIVWPTYSATDLCDGDLTASVTVGDPDPVDWNTVGDYQLTYDVDDAASNSALQRVVTVHVTSNAPPVITIPGANPLYIECHVGTWVEPAVTADDAEDGDITGDIVATWTGSPVDVNVVATYTRHYYVEDSQGASDAEDLIIHVVDTTDPVITCTPPAGPTIGRCGTYTLPGLHRHG